MISALEMRNLVPSRAKTITSDQINRHNRQGAQKKQNLPEIDQSSQNSKKSDYLSSSSSSKLKYGQQDYQSALDDCQLLLLSDNESVSKSSNSSAVPRARQAKQVPTAVTESKQGNRGHPPFSKEQNKAKEHSQKY